MASSGNARNFMNANRLSGEDKTMTKAMRAGRCTICGARVVAWVRQGLTARLVKLLAMADHLRTLHVQEG